ncbi:Cerato-platanin [Colletotrichum scovillei]|uniref:Cerato-platanin n=1 Tax=Colletotrichum scovillei TaxID=1209932 RepID=A0A9P7QQF8_9PEZI|nr:Cerato-platanin [Colletotrichum scovillei]KAG7040658.1 Cerato-platanin [Colletotrichum scovillei]KAG7060705.1 Cerato-platanin [Colletotrichum scovillei]
MRHVHTSEPAINNVNMPLLGAPFCVGDGAARLVLSPGLDTFSPVDATTTSPVGYCTLYTGASFSSTGMPSECLHVGWFAAGQSNSHSSSYPHAQTESSVLYSPKFFATQLSGWSRQLARKFMLLDALSGSFLFLVLRSSLQSSAGSSLYVMASGPPATGAFFAELPVYR